MPHWFSKYRFSLTIYILFCFSGSLFAQNSGTNTLNLKHGNLNLHANVEKWLDSINKNYNFSAPLQVIVEFNHMPENTQKEKLNSNGIYVLDYLSNNCYSALIKQPLSGELLNSYNIRSINIVKPEWKADTYLRKKIAAISGNVELLVSFYSCIYTTEIKELLVALGATINTSSLQNYGSYKVIIDASKVTKLASWYGVKSLSPVGILPLDLQSRPAVKGNFAISSQYGGHNLTGDSVTVGVGDNASGIYHIDLVDRITNFNPVGISHHGEHVNGIVGGAAIIDPLAGSIAPHVSLIDQFYDFILPESGALFYDYNMSITNNSYAVVLGDCSYAGTYDAYAQFVDTLALQYPYLLHVFASGNDGSNNCTPYLPGFATTAGGYQPAKNNIVVGSITDYLEQANDESRGPVKDGRIKPEIVAIGLGAYSTIDIDQYEWAAGTSMASPQVAGGLAALTQRYKQLNANALPYSDLLKAILLNGAMDLGNKGPDFSFGFGSMDLYRSLQILDSGHYYRNTVNNGDSQQITINVPANTAQLKVMLCWNDAPANLLAAKQLVNDLDLTVTEPIGTTHYPLVLDASPTNVNKLATEQPDHLNNIEQVTINNPSAGTYTFKVKGYNIPALSGTQAYSLVYDIIPQGVFLTFPIGGEQLSNIDSIRIFWESADTGNNTYTVKFSSDSGAHWTTIDNNVASNLRHSDFLPTGINSPNCLVVVWRNGTTEVANSGRFSINTIPVVKFDTVQCPGYLNIHWSPILNATSYYLLCKRGKYMQVIDSVSDTMYSFSNLSLVNKSYVAVQPLFTGIPGYRSIAGIKVADSGNCTNASSYGDLMIEKIMNPHSGRKYTSSQLSNIEPFQLKIRNLYNEPCDSFLVSYSINTGVWQNYISYSTIPANSYVIVNVANIDLSAIGTYQIKVAIHNLNRTDNNPANDTQSITVVQLQNDTINLNSPFVDDFETMPKFSVSNDSIGISPNGHWDYFNLNDSGRLRSFVSDNITISGTRSISLDEKNAVVAGSKNNFTGTFNLNNFDTSTSEIRIDYDYILHGTPKSADGNLIVARGVDTSSWMPLFAYDLSAYPGFLMHIQSLSLTDALRSGNRNFSSSTQISFGQNDTSLICLSNYGNGITIDNFKMYTVSNDAILAGVITPLPTNCGLNSNVPLIVTVKNGVNYTLHTIQLFYQLDGGITHTGTIDSLNAKATINFTFIDSLNIGTTPAHTLNIWLSETGDTYHPNDSIFNYQFRNSKIITAFPYLENFEAGGGGFFSAGFKNSWAYGTPASPKINKAASGTKAWKTNLTGNYNNLEKSYLYSPCYDIGNLYSPFLSFSAALDIENCGNSLCDLAYVEYSFDGSTWIKLGVTGQGTNWYDSTFDVWNTEGFTRWHVVSTPLPKPCLGQRLHLRFAMVADPGTNFEGFAVDDIHIYDRINNIFTYKYNFSQSQNVAGNYWNDFTYAFLILSSIQPKNQNLGNTNVTLYTHDTLNNPTATQYTFDRSYNIIPSIAPTDSIGIQLYLTENELVNVLNDTACPSCTKPIDAYSLGITQFNNPAYTNTENGTLLDDTGANFNYYSYKNIQWIPFDAGYYAQLNVKPLSELWFNDGGPTGSFPAGIDYLNFMALKTGSNVSLYWYSLIDTSVVSYTLQKSTDGINFTNIKDTIATHTNPGEYGFMDNNAFNVSNTLFYRLMWTINGKSTHYFSPIRTIDSNNISGNLATLNANMVSSKDILVNWQSFIDGIVSNYVLERAIDKGSYTPLTTVSSLKHYGQQYSYLDQTSGINYLVNGTPIHYKLTATLLNNSTVTLPVCTVNWENANNLINIYPNPSSNGVFNLVWRADSGTAMNVKITDALGRTLFETNAIATQWLNTTTLQTGHRAKGLYFVETWLGNHKYVNKIIMQ